MNNRIVTILKHFIVCDVIKIVYDYFDETKNNYRDLMNEYTTTFTWNGKHLTRGPCCDFYYNYRICLDGMIYNSKTWAPVSKLPHRYL